MSIKLIALAAAFAVLNPAYASPRADQLSQLDQRYPFEKGTKGGPKFFDVPQVRQALAAAVPRPWRQAMKKELTVVTPNRLVDGYLVASGCKPHACPEKNYIATIRVSDGAGLFIVFDSDEGRTRNPKSLCYSAVFSNIRELPEAVRSEVKARHGMEGEGDILLSCERR